MFGIARHGDAIPALALAVEVPLEDTARLANRAGDSQSSHLGDMRLGKGDKLVSGCAADQR
jgi:hypothetical protein